MDEHDRVDAPLVALYEGVVVDNADPMMIGRVKLRVPGVLDDSDWALPMGLPGGGEMRLGFFAVPPKGAEVKVWFVQGNPDRPCYVAGHWGAPGGQSQSPTPLQAPDVTPEDAHLISCFETPRFLLTFDNRSDKQSVELRDKVRGDGILMHGAQGALEIRATAGIKLSTVGAIKLEAMSVSINGRSVKIGDQPI
jgi:hypothetical protein